MNCEGVMGDPVLETPEQWTRPVEIDEGKGIHLARIELHDEGRIFVVIDMENQRLVGRYSGFRNAMAAFDREVWQHG